MRVKTRPHIKEKCKLYLDLIMHWISQYEEIERRPNWKRRIQNPVPHSVEVINAFKEHDQSLSSIDRV